MTRRGALAGLAVAAAATAALAHDCWLAPSNLRPKAGEEVSVRVLVGEDLAGEGKPRDIVRTTRFALIAPGGAETEAAGRHGDEPAARVKPDRDGTFLVVFRTGRRATTLAAEKFEHYLGEEGLERVVEERARRGESKADGVEVYSRCAKAILCVGEAGTEGHDRAAGFPLELFVEKHPNRIAPGDDVSFRLVHEGKPLEGALVIARGAAAPSVAVSGRTDREGRVLLRLGHAGFWMVKTTHMVRADREATLADWESTWASLAFDVPAPKPAAAAGEPAVPKPAEPGPVPPK